MSLVFERKGTGDLVPALELQPGNLFLAVEDNQAESRRYVDLPTADLD